ncbi:putative pyroglutamyl peptidase type I [Xylariales sp. AK1849]|nr:putative pyroglutamyl peptidase type I [Xylariales sp. AK1849]
MGSIETFDEEELTVLVTGFGPFKDQYPENPSWEIASSLPQYLPWDRVKDPAHKSSPVMPRVRLLVHPEPVRVNYMTVRELIPTLWDNPAQKIDLALHIGMAGPPVVYSVERRAHRDGYRHNDVDGHFLEDEKRHKREGEDWIWHGAPEELLTHLDVEDIYGRWIKRCPSNIERSFSMRISDDPGRYLCDFIYFSSLAHLFKQQRARKVLFLHVPAGAEHVRIGRELALNLIRSMVESEISKEDGAGKAKVLHPGFPDSQGENPV